MTGMTEPEMLEHLMNRMDVLIARTERLERQGIGRRLRAWLRDLTDVQLLSFITLSLAALVIFLLLEPVAGAAGNYVHKTNDPAYFDTETQTVVQDPYGVGEGAQSANQGNHVVYWGPIGPTRWQDIAADGWPYDLTRTFLAARYPPGVPGHFHFDHDAAAQLLPRGLTVEALDRLYAIGEGYGGLETTQG